MTEPWIEQKSLIVTWFITIELTTLTLAPILWWRPMIDRFTPICEPSPSIQYGYTVVVCPKLCSGMDNVVMRREGIP